MGDAPAATNIAHSTVASGSLTTFDQPYFECTQSCTDFTDHVALVALSHPSDSDRSTVMLVDTSHTLTTADLVTLAGTIATGS